MRSISGCDWIATASKPPICPTVTNDGCNWPSDCIVVEGRMCSSLARMVSPLTSFTEPRLQRRKARDVGASLADRIDHAEDDVINNVFRQIVALFQSLQRRRRQRQRSHFMQRAIGLAAAARGANVIIDIGLRHDALLI